MGKYSLPPNIDPLSTVTIGCRVPYDVKIQLMNHAHNNGCGISEYLTLFIMNGINNKSLIGNYTKENKEVETTHRKPAEAPKKKKVYSTVISPEKTPLNVSVPAEGKTCKRCDGSGEMIKVGSWKKDGNDEKYPCKHCNGTGIK